jgi:hypothetical protein
MEINSEQEKPTQLTGVEKTETQCAIHDLDILRETRAYQLPISGEEKIAFTNLITKALEDAEFDPLALEGLEEAHQKRLTIILYTILRERATELNCCVLSEAVKNMEPVSIIGKMKQSKQHNSTCDQLFQLFKGFNPQSKSHDSSKGTYRSPPDTSSLISEKYKNFLSKKNLELPKNSTAKEEITDQSKAHDEGKPDATYGPNQVFKVERDHGLTSKSKENKKKHNLFPDTSVIEEVLQSEDLTSEFIKDYYEKRKKDTMDLLLDYTWRQTMQIADGENPGKSKPKSPMAKWELMSLIADVRRQFQVWPSSQDSS